MSALVIPFPRRPPLRALCGPSEVLAPFTAAWCAQHLPLIDAAVDLLSADDDEFAALGSKLTNAPLPPTR